MNIDGVDAIALMRVVQRLKRKFIAKTLSDIEAEFAHLDALCRRVAALKAEVDSRDAINTTALIRMLNDFDTQTPDYAVVRKIVLDNFNEFARNIFQALLGDVEGYGSDRRRH